LPAGCCWDGICFRTASRRRGGGTDGPTGPFRATAEEGYVKALSIAPNGCRRRLPAEEAFAAIHWPALGWLKGYRGFPTALRAGGHGFRFGKARGRRTRTLGFTILTALRFVFEVFVVEEVLFSRCKYEVCSAVYALEDAVLKIRHINCAPLSTCTVPGRT